MSLLEVACTKTSWRVLLFRNVQIRDTRRFYFVGALLFCDNVHSLGGASIREGASNRDITVPTFLIRNIQGISKMLSNLSSAHWLNFQPDQCDEYKTQNIFCFFFYCLVNFKRRSLGFCLQDVFSWLLRGPWYLQMWSAPGTCNNNKQTLEKLLAHWPLRCCCNLS